MTIEIKCNYEPEHTHSYPDDWDFGDDPETLRPRTDHRGAPDSYYYLDDHLQVVWVSSVALCDDQALDEFTRHRDLGAVYLQVRRNGDHELTTLPWQYDPKTDLLKPF